MTGQTPDIYRESLLVIKRVDVFWFNEAWSFVELFFILLIAVGIVGLTFVAPAF